MLRVALCCACPGVGVLLRRSVPRCCLVAWRTTGAFQASSAVVSRGIALSAIHLSSFIFHHRHSKSGYFSLLVSHCAVWFAVLLSLACY
jgi:hypothetical protein